MILNISVRNLIRISRLSYLILIWIRFQLIVRRGQEVVHQKGNEFFDANK